MARAIASASSFFLKSWVGGEERLNFIVVKLGCARMPSDSFVCLGRPAGPCVLSARTRSDVEWSFASPAGDALRKIYQYIRTMWRMAPTPFNRLRYTV
jgi:hypothetical protein